MTTYTINYNLKNPMSNFQYMRIHIRDITHEVIIEYSLLSIADLSGHVHVEIRKGMYGLEEARIIAYKRLLRNLQPHGYTPVENTLGLWTHSTLTITFTLAVDDFGIKLFSANDATHLIDALQDHYSITIDPSGSKYCGLTINWNYPNFFSTSP